MSETDFRNPRRRGRPPACPPDVVKRIIELRSQGLSLSAISNVLNQEGIRTPGGGARWQKSYVDRLLHTRYARELIDELVVKGRPLVSEPRCGPSGPVVEPFSS
ncbi:recombinase family protein [Microbispora amethystogenes]|uniref:recombinase family protein n=1 Tax=Microbispora amethystogenes TaxID=1427754 RepID=UPI0035A222A9